LLSRLLTGAADGRLEAGGLEGGGGGGACGGAGKGLLDLPFTWRNADAFDRPTVPVPDDVSVGVVRGGGGGGGTFGLLSQLGGGGGRGDGPSRWG